MELYPCIIPIVPLTAPVTALALTPPNPPPVLPAALLLYVREPILFLASCIAFPVLKLKLPPLPFLMPLLPPNYNGLFIENCYLN